MKAIRLKSDCCGMKAGQEYEAEGIDYGSGFNYIRCQLPDGKWTTNHWVGTPDSPWFEIIADKPKSAEAS